MDNHIIEYLPIPKKSPNLAEIPYTVGNSGICFKNGNTNKIFPLYKNRQITILSNDPRIATHLATILCRKGSSIVKIDILDITEDESTYRCLWINYVNDKNLVAIGCLCSPLDGIGCSCTLRSISCMKYDGFMTNPNFGLLSCNDSILMHANDSIFRITADDTNIVRKCRPTTEKAPITYDIAAPQHLFKICVQVRNWLKKQNIAKWLAHAIICELILNNDFVTLKPSFVDIIMAAY
jgi:hypothetical protein